MRQKKLLEQEEIYLRAMEPEDLELLYTIENDTVLWDIGSSCTPYSRYALKKFISQQPQDIYQCGELRLVICLKGENKAIGLVDLINFTPLDRRAEVGIALLKSARGKGHGKAALGCIERFSTEVLRMHQLYAYISAENNPESNRLFQSSGYQRIALLPEWHFYHGTYEDILLYQKILSKT